jgi:membrane protein implicated in regulation of membrane protease activity
MYLVLIAWIYVAFMMAIAEATSPVGSLLGAAITFLLYGVLPMSVVGYIMGTPARRRAIKAKEAAEREEARATNGIQNAGGDGALVAPNTHGKASGHTITPERKEP